MDLESYTIKMVALIKGLGKTEKSKDLENYIISQEIWHMKDIGLKDNFMVKER